MRKGYPFSGMDAGKGKLVYLLTIRLEPRPGILLAKYLSGFESALITLDPMRQERILVPLQGHP